METFHLFLIMEGTHVPLWNSKIEKGQRLSTTKNVWQNIEIHKRWHIKKIIIKSSISALFIQN